MEPLHNEKFIAMNEMFLIKRPTCFAKNPVSYNERGGVFSAQTWINLMYEKLNEWINESMNEPMNEWSKEWVEIKT